VRQIVYDLTPHLILDGLVSTVKRSSELGFLTQNWLGLCLETNLKQRRREGVLHVVDSVDHFQYGAILKVI